MNRTHAQPRRPSSFPCEDCREPVRWAVKVNDQTMLLIDIDPDQRHGHLVRDGVPSSPGAAVPVRDLFSAVGRRLAEDPDVPRFRCHHCPNYKMRHRGKVV